MPLRNKGLRASNSRSRVDVLPLRGSARTSSLLCSRFSCLRSISRLVAPPHSSRGKPLRRCARLPRITPSEARRLTETASATVLDVRTRSEDAARHITSAGGNSHKEFDRRALAKLPNRAAVVLVYRRNETRSAYPSAARLSSDTTTSAASVGGSGRTSDAPLTPAPGSRTRPTNPPRPKAQPH